MEFTEKFKVSDLISGYTVPAGIAIMFYIYNMTFFRFISNPMALMVIATTIFSMYTCFYLKEEQKFLANMRLGKILAIGIIVLPLALGGLYLMKEIRPDYLKLFYRYSIGFERVKIIGMVILMPLIEEMFFRGYAYSSMRRVSSHTGAMLFSSFIYATATPYPLFMFVRFVLGIGNSAIYREGRSLLPCIILNSLVSLIIFMLLKQ